jgi:hypothetical protein
LSGERWIDVAELTDLRKLYEAALVELLRDAGLVD